MIGIWVGINIVTAIGVALIACYMVIAYGDEVLFIERVGIVGVAVSMILRCCPIFFRNILDMDTPFDNWSTSLMHISLALAFGGWLWRRDHVRWRIRVGRVLPMSRRP